MDMYVVVQITKTGEPSLSRWLLYWFSYNVKSRTSSAMNGRVGTAKEDGGLRTG